MTAVPRSHLVRFAQLAALWAFSVSQPVFSLLEGNPEFLVLRDSTRVEMIAFAVVLAFGPPLAAVVYSGAAGLVSQWVGDRLFLAALTAFLVPLAFQVVKPIEPGRMLAIAVVFTLCAIAVIAYLRWHAVRLLLAFAVVLPVVGVAWFVHEIPAAVDDAKTASVAIHEPRPVVLVVLDELPLTSLLARDGQIDSIRYPNFGRLARDSTWYPNATTVHALTTFAVPAILSGTTSRPGAMPTVRDHPANLFTMLRRSYRLWVHEALTRLCPEVSCPKDDESFLDGVNQLFDDVRAPYILNTLPYSMTGGWEGVVAADPIFTRAADSTVAEFDRFLAEFSPAEERNTLHFMHLMLPHHPWRYLPSGKRYEFPTPDGRTASGIWVEDSWRVDQALQRHLVQLQYTDALLGRLMRKLARVGLYDRGLLVVVADHGARFRPGKRFREANDEGTIDIGDIASVPLFVKYPGQVHGAVDPRAARTVDVLPTIADVLGMRLPTPVDGVSLLGVPPPRADVVIARKNDDDVHASLEAVEGQNRATLRRNVALFGDGRDSLYWLGTHRQLWGTAVVDAWPASPTVRVRLEHASDLRHVRKASGVVPAFVEGVVEAGQISAGTELAIAVNGHVRALTRCFLDRGAQRFQALVPESALHDGRNRVDVYAIEAGGSRLVHLGGTES